MHEQYSHLRWLQCPIRPSFSWHNISGVPSCLQHAVQLLPVLKLPKLNRDIHHFVHKGYSTRKWATLYNTNSWQTIQKGSRYTIQIQAKKVIQILVERIFLLLIYTNVDPVKDPKDHREKDLDPQFQIQSHWIGGPIDRGPAVLTMYRVGHHLADYLFVLLTRIWLFPLLLPNMKPRSARWWPLPGS